MAIAHGASTLRVPPRGEPCSRTSTKKSLPAPCHFCNDRSAIFLVSHEPIGASQNFVEPLRRFAGVIKPLHSRIALEPRTLASCQTPTLGDGVLDTLLEIGTLFEVAK